MGYSFKSSLRDLIPDQHQVPTKYWLDKVRGYAEPEIELLQHLFSRGDRVLDVGGNRGVYAYHCWRLGGVVEIFEPNPVCVRVLEAWVSRKQSVTLHSVALSNVPGTAQLHIPIDTSGIEHDASASIINHGFSTFRDQPILLRTLDSFGFSDARFIKIDVEGHESKVIQGAATTLATSRPALLIEIEQRHLEQPIGEVFQQVQDHGYSGFFIKDGRLSALAGFDPELHQNMEEFLRGRGLYINNFLFLHEARFQSGEYGALPGLSVIK